jgi:hypothetical protein
MSIPLTIELIPKPLWGKSLKHLLSQEEWNRLRRRVYRTCRYQCQACGATDTMMYCHEVWAYDEEQHIQRLSALLSLCELCHHIKHLGYAEKAARTGRVDMEALITHFCLVTGHNRADFEMLREVAFEQWAYRSTLDWTQDFGTWADLVETAT